MVMDRATLESLSPLAAEGSLDAVIIAGGENAALPHADVSDRVLKKGDLLIADIFFRYKGYCSDCTRTFAIGAVDKDRRTAYNAVLEAELKGIELARVGVTGRSVHDGVKSELDKRDLGRYFTHGTGHGVGIDVHEEPSLGARSAATLEPGDVVTVEPGVYLPGKYGVRVEDTVVVRENQSRVLFNNPKDELLVLG
jgi:Xaa-Pro aminopeptidase